MVMVATATPVKLAFEEYLRQYPEGEGKFELVNGEFVKVDATRAHKNIARVLMFNFNDEIRRLGIDYVVDKDIIIRTVGKTGDERGRIPDVSVNLECQCYCLRCDYRTSRVSSRGHFYPLGRRLY